MENTIFYLFGEFISLVQTYELQLDAFMAFCSFFAGILAYVSIKKRTNNGSIYLVPCLIGTAAVFLFAIVSLLSLYDSSNLPNIYFVRGFKAMLALTGTIVYLIIGFDLSKQPYTSEVYLGRFMMLMAALSPLTILLNIYLSM